MDYTKVAMLTIVGIVLVFGITAMVVDAGLPGAHFGKSIYMPKESENLRSVPQNISTQKLEVLK